MSKTSAFARDHQYIIPEPQGFSHVVFAPCRSKKPGLPRRPIRFEPLDQLKLPRDWIPKPIGAPGYHAPPPRPYPRAPGAPEDHPGGGCPPPPLTHGAHARMAKALPHKAIPSPSRAPLHSPRRLHTRAPTFT
jgi:hypothetical protein